MKQGSFIIEFVKSEYSLLYIVRVTNGQIVRICHDAEALSDFFEETEDKILSNPNSNKNEEV